MKTVTIKIDDIIYEFYKKIGETAGGIPVEQVMSDAMFKIAGELSLNAIYNKNKEK